MCSCGSNRQHSGYGVNALQLCYIEREIQNINVKNANRVRHVPVVFHQGQTFHKKATGSCHVRTQDLLAMRA